MGLWISRLMARFGEREERILMLGLDAAGKTTVLYNLKLGEVIHSIPTIGFNVETVKYKSVSFNVWDIGGQKKLRGLWHHYFRGSSALIYIVDSSDAERFAEASEELHSVLGADEMRGVPCLVFANKQDLPGAQRPLDVAKELGLPGLRDHEWYIQGCCATTGDGLYDGLDWLTGALERKARA